MCDDRGRMPHIGDDDGGALWPIAGRAPDDLRDSLAIAAALVDRPELQIGRAPEEAYWLLAGLRGVHLDSRASVAAPLPRPHFASDIVANRARDRGTRRRAASGNTLIGCGSVPSE